MTARTPDAVAVLHEVVRLLNEAEFRTAQRYMAHSDPADKRVYEAIIGIREAVLALADAPDPMAEAREILKRAHREQWSADAVCRIVGRALRMGVGDE